MNAISPGVYTRITVLETYVEEVPSSTGLVAIICDKGEDGKLKYVTSREQFLKETGNPNTNKYGRWAHGHHIGERFTTASPSLYYIRVLPNDATIANSAFWLLRRPSVKFTDGQTDPSTYTWTEKTFISESNSVLIGESSGHNTFSVEFDYEGYVGPLENITSIDTISSNFTPSNFKKVPEVYIQGVSGGTTYTFKVYQDNLVLVSTSATVQVEPTIILGDDASTVYKLEASIVASGSGGFPIPGTTNEATIIATAIGSYDAVNDKIPSRYVTNFNGDLIYQINVDATGNVHFTDVTATYSGDAYDLIVPLFVIRGAGKGQYYNNYRYEFARVQNKDFVYVFSPYEKKADNNYHSLGSFYVSFRPEILDDSGESLFIKNILQNYVDDLDIEINEDNLDEIRHTVLVDFTNNLLNAPYQISDYLNSAFVYQVEDFIESLPTDAFDGTYYFVLNRASGSLFAKDGKVIKIDSTDPNGFVEVDDVDANRLVYNKKDSKLYLHFGLGNIEEYDPFVHFLTLESNENDRLDHRVLENGSDGSLFNPATGNVDDAIATDLLVNSYRGITDANILSTENIWFDLVFCGGYPREVEDAAVELCKLRQDCIMIGDLGDNPNLETAIRKRIEVYSYNTMFAALFEPYRLIRDSFSGKDIWVSPVYHMAFLLATNDRINEVWYAVAGFERGMADGIKKLRYDPQLSDRDQMYLNQINPTAHFKEGKVVWGQLTTQRKADAMQDINIVRCVLYIKRALENFCRYFIFDFNDELTWVNIENGISEFLKQVKEKRGLYSYSVSVGADEYLRKRKSARVSVILEPTRILEKLYLDFYIK